jgi:hypothetical protein
MLKSKYLSLLNILGFALMILLNGLANGLPLNGKNTGQLSDQYPNLFVPAGLTFSIWGIIYLLLLIFCIYQIVLLFSPKPSTQLANITEALGIWVAVNGVLNALWIFVWHYEYLYLSLAVMLGLLYSLVVINTRLRDTASKPRSLLGFVAQAGFGIYFGWICIATIANTTAVLVGKGIGFEHFTEEIITLVMILIGSVIVFLTSTRLQNFYIALAVVWALCGIIIARQRALVYSEIIIYGATFGIALMILASIRILRSGNLNAS